MLILKLSETVVLNILCAGTLQWLKLNGSTSHTFYTYSLPSKPFTVQVLSSYSKFPAILASFLLDFDFIR